MGDKHTLPALVVQLLTFLWKLKEKEAVVVWSLYAQTITNESVQALAKQYLLLVTQSEILEYIANYDPKHLDELPADLWEDILAHRVGEVTVYVPR